ncbi:MAG: molybdopterin-binding protein [Acetobacteraceae bacterium]
MAAPESSSADLSSTWHDIRGLGFTAGAPLARAWAWLDSGEFLPDREPLAPAQAVGRVLASDVCAGRDWPPADRAAIDGFAVRAADTESAGVYNPVPLVLSNAPGAGRAFPVFTGASLPPGTDAVLAFSAVSRPASGRLEVLNQAAPGEGVVASASALSSGTTALPAERPIRPQDAALLAMLGIQSVPVFVRPKVRLVIAGAKESDAEALEPMLHALVVRDGGLPAISVSASLTDALAAASQADVICIAGRSGAGEDDLAAPALVRAGGDVALHGIAIRPGASSGLGRLGGKPVILLPGEPLACLTAYDLLAGRLIRRLAGFSLELPYPRATWPLGRKIVSAIGFTDVVPVAPVGETVVPIASAESAALAASCRALGFVVVAENLEGHAEGESVFVSLYDLSGRYLYC